MRPLLRVRPTLLALLSLLVLLPFHGAVSAQSTVDTVISDDSSVSSEGGESLVVELSDATFEQLTQASTGATTGDWLVAFFAPSHTQQHTPADRQH